MISRSLKKSVSVVLASFRSSTYPRGYASALHSLRPCWTAFSSLLRGLFLLLQTCWPLKVLRSEAVFQQHVRWRTALVCLCFVAVIGLQAGCITVNLIEPSGPVKEVQLSGTGAGKVLLLDLSGVISS